MVLYFIPLQMITLHPWSRAKEADLTLDHGCSVIICNGMKYNTIRNIMAGNAVGTMFTPLEMQGTSVEVLAKNARTGS